MSENLKTKVLIVDDHFTARQLVAEAMRAHNVDFSIAANGKEAIESIQQAHKMEQPFDIVFLDRDLPIIDGLEVLTFFRAQPAFSRTAFIMLTAAAEQQEVLKAIKAGATSYLAKPVSKASISKKFLEIMEWLKKQKSAGDRLSSRAISG
jgi:CheY-like chemotaxis protein